MIEVIIGPTASGKSALAVDRALQHGNAVIINADAMQCYDALPVLTAQPTAGERKNIPHALYSVLDARECLTAAGWVTRAVKEIETALAAHKKPYLVGGTGMYVKALMEGLSPMPDIPDDIRADIRGSRVEDLYRLLQDNDPASAARLKPGDTQRVMRAAEVFLATGTPLSEWQAVPPVKPHDGWDFHVVQLRPEKERLEKKIRTRLDAMLKNNVLDEVKALSDRIDAGDVPADAPVIVAHGFRSLRDVVKGRRKLDDVREDIVIETRQYTKRQRTWLRHQIRADEIIQ